MHTEVCGFLFVWKRLGAIPIHRATKKGNGTGAVPYDVNFKWLHFAGVRRSFGKILRNGHDRSLHGDRMRGGGYKGKQALRSFAKGLWSYS